VSIQSYRRPTSRDHVAHKAMHFSYINATTTGTQQQWQAEPAVNNSAKNVRQTNMQTTAQQSSQSSTSLLEEWTINVRRMPHLGVSELQNPWTNWHKIWHGWLCWWCQITITLVEASRQMCEILSSLLMLQLFKLRHQKDTVSNTTSFITCEPNDWIICNPVASYMLILEFARLSD